MNDFEDFGLDEQLLAAIKKLGYSRPTLIQGRTIPLIMAGKDVIGESETGSGKTLAFGCGIVKHVAPREGVQALILVPTRELAEQVSRMLNQISHQKSLSIIAVYGGVAINPQIHDLQRANVVVATPGRLLDHLERRTVNMSRTKMLVLDEADRMFDMGFIDDVEKIIRACPAKRQTLFFSATISQRVMQLANRHMNNPVKVSAGKHVDPSKLKQVYYNVSKNSKLSLLIHLMQNENNKLAMVFCNTRRTTDFVVKNLQGNKIPAIAIHGGLTQPKRARTIRLFNEGKPAVLVCTDVAARGLHINNVSHIYNYEIPKNPVDYVHRIGRTARAGEEGKVINLLSELDHDNFSRLLREYRSFSIDSMQMPQLDRIFSIRTERTDNERRFSGRRPSLNRPRRSNFHHGSSGRRSRPRR